MEYNYDSLIINDMPKKFYKEEHQLSYYISNKEVSIIDAYIHYNRCNKLNMDHTIIMYKKDFTYLLSFFCINKYDILLSYLYMREPDLFIEALNESFFYENIFYNEPFLIKIIINNIDYFNN